MSVQAMTWAFDHSEASGNARLVLLSIANHAGRYGENAYPSVPTIMAEARIKSRTTVNAAIEQLEAAGDVLVYPGQGRSNGGRPSNRYELPRVPGWTPPSGITPRANGSTSELFDGGDFRAIDDDLSRDPDPTFARSEGDFRATGRARTQEPSYVEPKNETDDERARRVLDVAWQRRKAEGRTPAQYHAAIRTTKALLKAGRTEEAVIEALYEAPTISIGACEIVLDRTRRRRGPTIAESRQRLVDLNEQVNGRRRGSA